ncbi:hypothetical protein TWF694_001199 [Orbilia ellipsospora]|uniref:Uncharacterized protein n=1 Tax=Orbilia ellipsospora TaxID=2528407 RepID=A0AAV9XSS3_9PEZI
MPAGFRIELGTDDTHVTLRSYVLIFGWNPENVVAIPVSKDHKFSFSLEAVVEIPSCQRKDIVDALADLNQRVDGPDYGWVMKEIKCFGQLDDDEGTFETVLVGVSQECINSDING